VFTVSETCNVISHDQNFELLKYYFSKCRQYLHRHHQHHIFSGCRRILLIEKGRNYVKHASSCDTKLGNALLGVTVPIHCQSLYLQRSKHSVYGTKCSPKQYTSWALFTYIVWELKIFQTWILKLYVIDVKETP